MRRLVTEVLDREEKDMGKPLPDAPGQDGCQKLNTDGSVDFYLLTPKQKLPRSGQKELTGGHPPYGLERSEGNGNSCSGYMVINRRETHDRSQLRDTLYHELYHLLQDRYNCDTHTWFREASATWAAVHYASDNPASVRYTSGWFATFPHNFQASQPRALNPDCEECDPAYADFIWPSFMNQEGASVAAVWKESHSAASSAAFDRLIDSKLSFARTFHDFAVRDLQLLYHEQGSTQAGKTFTSHGGLPQLPQVKPRSYQPKNTTLLEDTSGKDRSESIALPAKPLEAYYEAIDLPDKSQVPDLHLDLSSLPDSDDVDVLLQGPRDNGPGWQLRHLHSKKLLVCRNNPEDAIDKMIVVISHHDYRGKGPGHGQFKYSMASSCPFAVTGTLKIATAGSGSSSDSGGGCSSSSDWTQSWSGTVMVNYVYNPNSSQTARNNSTSSLSGQVGFNYASSCSDGASRQVHASGQLNGNLNGDNATAVGGEGYGEAHVTIFFEALGLVSATDEGTGPYHPGAGNCYTPSSQQYASGGTPITIPIDLRGRGHVHVNDTDLGDGVQFTVCNQSGAGPQSSSVTGDLDYSPIG